MNVYETLGGVVRLVQEARAELRRTDALMHELEATLGGPQAPRDLREEWAPVRRAWEDLALDTPLLRPGEPRVTSEEVKRTVARARDVKRRGLEIYKTYKERGGKVGSTPRSRVSGPDSGVKNGALRFALIGAALLSGAAAAKVLFGGRKREEIAAAPPAQRPVVVTAQLAALAPALAPPVMVYPPPLYYTPPEGDDE